MKSVLVLGYMESIRVVLSDKKEGKTLSITSRLKNTFKPVSSNPEDVYYKYILGEPRFSKKAELSRLINIWKRYNMNDMRNGTVKQTEALMDMNLNYQESVEYLKSINLLEDEGHIYGSKYLFEEIPEDVIKELMFIMNEWK